MDEMKLVADDTNTLLPLLKDTNTFYTIIPCGDHSSAGPGSEENKLYHIWQPRQGD